MNEMIVNDSFAATEAKDLTSPGYPNKINFSTVILAPSIAHFVYRVLTLSK